MKGCYMSNQEIGKIEILEKLVRKEIKQKKAGEVLGVSVRQVKRLVKRYKQEGASGLVHKARGKVSNNKISQKELDLALSIIHEKYEDFGPTLAHEKLMENHEVSFSVERLRQEMIGEDLWKAKSRKIAHVHQLRERRSCYGELVQLDGSPHPWFEGRGSRCNLNVMIDDATGKVMMRFSVVETTQDYLELLEEYILTYGVPAALYVDQHSIFRINNKAKYDHKKPTIHNNKYEGLTQFGRVCKELRIKLIFANTPQAKGRVERVNKTLQNRMLREMRLHNISTIEEANQFLPKYTERFNKKFSVSPKLDVNVHRQLDKNIDLSRILCTKHARVLSKNLTCQYDNTVYQIKTTRSPYALRKTTVTICQRYDDSITILDDKGNKLDYTTIKILPSTQTTTSKQVNHKVDDILIKKAKTSYKKKNHFDLSWEELGQHTNSYRPHGAV